MGDDVMVDVLRKMLWISVLLSAPALLMAMGIGLVVGLFQAVTSIQEQTLAFVPKLVGILLILALLGNWMLRTAVDYTAELINALPQFGAM
ncbi:MAG: flagellar biosynthesis protein FliQ [Planctomycetes bacterium]|jgi:flagellar biosynthetic protein FliQ|nr:flagellar biosynthesis protein FliQ [Planctomycetota bacterium]